jgi:hypothetical protein
VCKADIANAALTTEGDKILVGIPVWLSSKERTNYEQQQYTLNMTLARDGDSFRIVQLEGEEFYQNFQRIKNINDWEARQLLVLQSREEFISNARKLETQFDSVVWFTEYEQKSYFYVVEGPWVNKFMDYETRNEVVTGIKMGLVNAMGEIVIPIEYDLIGTIAFHYHNLAEVKQNGKVGYFNIDTKQLVVPAVYDMIIPYDDSRTVVKQDTLIGWLDKDFAYHAGFESNEMESWYRNFDYLKKPIMIKAGHYAFAEIPSAEYAANGIIVPPAYLSKHGVFNFIESGFSLTETPVSGYTEYMQTTSSIIERISNSLRAVAVTIQERYLDGREEFYDYSQVVFVDDKLNPVGQSTISGTSISMHMVDSTLLEVRTPHDFWFLEEDACEESNLMKHIYFSVGKSDSVIQLNSRRLYSQTKYVKLDSTYLTGTFTLSDFSENKGQTRDFLSEKTITYMRDEILGDNGYNFPDIKEEYFHHFDYLRDKDDPVVATVAEAEARMSATDKANYDFLNRVLQRMQQSL